MYNIVRNFEHKDAWFGLKPLPKLGTAADPFRFMDAHCWDFTKQSSFFSVTKGPDYGFKLCIFSKESKYTA